MHVRSRLAANSIADDVLHSKWYIPPVPHTTQHSSTDSVLLLRLQLMRRFLVLSPAPSFFPLPHALPRARSTYPSQANQPTALLRTQPRQNSNSTMATTTLARAVGKLQPVSTTFLLCDIQERFRDVIWHFPQVRREQEVEEGRGSKSWEKKFAIVSGSAKHH